MERTRRRRDALLLSFSAWMADRHPRPLRPVTRQQYVWTVRRAMTIAESGGYSVMVADLRAIRFVLGKVPPHPASQNAYIDALRAFYDFLNFQGIRKDNPVRKLGRPPRHRTAPRPMPMEDCCSYLDAAFRLSLPHYLIACLGLYMGLRAGEIRRLRWVDFFEAEGRLWCDVDGKGGRRARVPVHPQVRAVLQRRQTEVAEAQWVFPSPITAKYGQPVADGWVRTKHLEIVEEAGIAHCTPHQLRHSFATYLRRTGVDIAVVKDGLRHSNLASTQIYTAVLPEELAEAIDRLDFGGTR